MIMFGKLGPIDGYSYYVSNESDEEGKLASDSSDDEQPLDEVNVFLHGTPDQKRRVFQRLTGDEQSSSDDEFEKTMKKELNDQMSSLERSWGGGSTGECSQSTSKQEHQKDDEYNDIYFDSDEEQGQKTKAQKKRLSNDQLFYDPGADDKDQRWINRQRLRGSSKKKLKNRSSSKKQNKTESDAMLSCPACMTTLCVDCQRHDVYQDQYRAMFVLNCCVQKDELLHYKEPKKKRFKRHRRSEQSTTQSTSDQDHLKDTNDAKSPADHSYHPVKCSTCSTEVAVYDHDEVYHFFNVIAGHA